MISVGIDAEDINRFAQWHKYTQKSLLRIFHDTELAYCLSVKNKSAERFAALWATKEACYKALNLFFTTKISYSYFCKQITLHHTQGIPQADIAWHMLPFKSTFVAQDIHISITHTKYTAIALILIS